jgi:exodeoxyribonuclease VII small subunit
MADDLPLDPSPASQPAPEPDFESLVKDLTQVVERLERGNLSLDESIALYARGSGLLQSAQRTLDGAQARLDVLVASADGTARLEPRDPAEFQGEKP